MSYRMEELLQAVKQPLICMVDQDAYEYEHGRAACVSMMRRDAVQGKTLRYQLQEIASEDGRVVMKFKKEYAAPNNMEMDAAWIQEHIEQYGKAPDPFDGV